MYDIFFVSKNQDHPEFMKLKQRFPMAKLVETVADARKRSLTRLYWVVWEDIIVLDTFKFDYMADPSKMNRVFAFLNTNGSYGIKLIPKHIQKPDFDDVNEVDIVASRSANNPFDIVFISNGEPMAEDNWARLEQLIRRAPNRLLRISGVPNRTEAFKEAAKLANTHCFFAVFAKIKIDEKFDWSWTCSTHEKRHYVFEALNPVNGLVYGHQAVIAYNRELVETHPGNQIDFTMAQSYKSVPIMSGVALFNATPALTWRTAFREALKLQLYKNQGDPMALHRLNTWLSPSDGQYSEWSQMGAQDAIEYFEAVDGDYDKLLLSYNWQWLDEYFMSKHG
jgi:hypothetical protein